METEFGELKMKDCGEQTIKCSDCNKPIMHYRVYVPAANTRFKLKANCPFCNGASFVHTVDGMFYYGPIGVDESVNATIVEDIEMDGENATFKVIKNESK